MTTQRYALAADAAEFYESTFVPALFAPWADRLVAATDLAPGMSVLDVACGTGVVARAAADRVGPTGTVVGVDSSEAMLAVARRVRPDVRWQVGDAGSLPFEADAFDRVLCQAALMFVDDPVLALREMGRVAAAGGRVVVQVPGRLSRSAGYLALADVVERRAGAAARDLLASYFAAGDPDRLLGWCGAAGLVVDHLDTWTGATRLGSVRQFVDVELLPLAASLDAGVREVVVRESVEALAPWTSPGGAVAAPIEVHLVTARPGS